MKYNIPAAPQPWAEKTDYLNPPKVSRAAGSPGAPRCSLNVNILLDNDKLLDDRLLRLEQFQGQESLAQLFEFQLVLRANDYFSSGIEQPWANSQEQNYGAPLDPANPHSYQLDFNAMIGANTTVRLGTPETEEDQYQRPYSDRPQIYFNGIISSFAMADRGVYHATLKPALFKLSLQSHYRLFSQMTILQVVMQILEQNTISYNKLELTKQPNEVVTGLANYRKQDWLQAGESDLEFIQRLMQKVNLFFYFVHGDQQHSMIITDQPHYAAIYTRKINAQGNNEISDEIKPLFLSYSQQHSLERDDYISQFKYQQNLVSAGITQILAQKQAVWESQNTAQCSPVYRNNENTKDKLNIELMHIVQYGASEAEVNKLTDVAVNKLVAGKYQFSGSSSCADLKAGHKFCLQENSEDAAKSQLAALGRPPLPIRPELQNKLFVVVSVQHQASASGDYKNQFSAVDAAGLPSSLDSHGGSQGSILALVVDKPGTNAATMGETDEALASSRHKGSGAKYLEKNSFCYDNKQFHFNTEDSQNSYACRGVYVLFVDQADNASPQWVKLAEHMQTIPETGTYVTVSRSADDNEIPEIQQAIDAKGSKNIMPENYSTQTSVGNSYNTNYGDSTRISFGNNINTGLSVAKYIVERQRSSGQYNEVNYGESSAYGYNVSLRSHHVSMTGEGTRPPDSFADMAAFVSYAYSATYGDSKNISKTVGNSSQISSQDGNTTSVSSITGSSVNQSVVGGDASQLIAANGQGYTSYRTDKIMGKSYQKSVVTGKSESYNSNSGGTHSESTTTGGAYNWSKVDTSNQINIVGASTGESVTGASHNVSVTGISSNESVTGSDTRITATANANNASATLNSNSASATLNSNSASYIALDNTASMVGGGYLFNQDNRPNMAVKSMPDIEMTTFKVIM